MIENSKLYDENGIEDFEIIDPDASALIESLRAFGYDVPSAIADLVDNSITAGSVSVYVDFIWEGKNSYIKITDTGMGMTENQLRDAMRPGSKNPLDSRDPQDLGRFGLGLKTASFSQCRRLTVASKTIKSPAQIKVWDLDLVKEKRSWTVKKSAFSESIPKLSSINDLDHGTIVLWEKLDRIVGIEEAENKDAEKRFYRIAERTVTWLEMIFHRLIENNKIRIYINGDDENHLLKPWDPFLEKHMATLRYPIDPLKIASGTVLVEGFVLPHKDKLGDDAHSRAAGPNGWNAQQGFYVYRNDRLLVPGDWLGLGRGGTWRKEEHYKLARIKIDISNKMDHDWQIDVKKSTAIPPGLIRSRLTELASIVRSDAWDVYRHRGEGGSPGKRRKTTITRIWIHKKRGKYATWKIDREHPLVRDLVSAECTASEDVEGLLRVIEETVPRNQIWFDMSQDSEAVPKPFEYAEAAEVRKIVKLMYSRLRNEFGMSAEQALGYIQRFDAFRFQENIIEIIAAEYEEDKQHG